MTHYLRITIKAVFFEKFHNMKKVIVTLAALLVMGSMAFAQDAAKMSDKKVEKKTTTKTATKTKSDKMGKKTTKKTETKTETKAK